MEFHRFLRRLFVTFFGGIVFLVGVALLVLPGPGLVTIFISLLILATEYDFARSWLEKMKCSWKRVRK